MAGTVPSRPAAHSESPTDRRILVMDGPRLAGPLQGRPATHDSLQLPAMVGLGAPARASEVCPTGPGRYQSPTAPACRVRGVGQARPDRGSGGQGRAHIWGVLTAGNSQHNIPSVSQGSRDGPVVTSHHTQTPSWACPTADCLDSQRLPTLGDTGAPGSDHGVRPRGQITGSGHSQPPGGTHLT